MIYTLVLTKDEKPIFTYEIKIAPDHPNAEEIAAALEVFRMDFRETSLLEEDIAIRFDKKGE